MNATKKQLDYAYAIADKLGIKRPPNDFEEVKHFIHINVDSYRRKSNKEFLLNQNYKFKEYEKGKFTEKARKKLYEMLWGKSGLYTFLDSDKNILYIGKSINLGERILSSFSERIKNVDIKYIGYYVEENIADVNILEIMLITENNPILNAESRTLHRSNRFKSGIDIINDFNFIQMRVDNL